MKIFATSLLLAQVSALRLGMQPRCCASAGSDAYSKLSGTSLLRVSDGSSVALTDEWSSDERAAVFFFRSFG
eukprot:6207747-Pleurochrysis_carterae.AAC.5